MSNLAQSNEDLRPLDANAVEQVAGGGYDDGEICGTGTRWPIPRPKFDLGQEVISPVLTVPALTGLVGMA